MKKTLIYTTLLLSLTACTGQLKEAKDNIIKSSAKTAITEICMQKYNNDTMCKCMTDKLIDSLEMKDIKYLAKKAIKGITIDDLVKDSVIGKKIANAQIQCTTQKAISKINTFIKNKLSK